MAFEDIVGTIFQNRMDQITQPFTDPESYARQRFGLAPAGGETEEEKRKRLAKEAADRANTEVHTQQTTTYADGSKQHTTTTQEPAAPVAPPPVQQQPVVAQAPAPVQQQPVAAPAAPVAPPTMQPVGYNQYIAGQESGANPNIGYHNPAKSSAYGTYGITAPAYKDIQAANPAFANRPITSLTPEEQTQANDTLRGVYGKQLQAQGVEPSEGNLRLSHLLGANGAKKYLENGYLSPEAMAANGGEAKLRQIAESRMGSVAPTAVAPGQPTMQKTSLAAPAANPEATDFHDDLIKAQKDADSLHAIAADKTGRYTKEQKAIAADMAFNYRKKEQEELRAEQIGQGMAQGEPKATSEGLREIRKRTEEGSYLKAYLFSRLGLNELAKQEQQKLSGGEYSKALLDGKSYAVEVKNGAIVNAFDNSGKTVSNATLAKLNASSTPQGTHQYGFTGEPGIVTENGKQYEVRQRTNTINGTIENVYVTGPKAGERYTGSEIPMAKSVNTSAAKATNAANIGIAAAAPQSYNKAAGGSAGAFNQANNANQPVNTMGAAVANPVPLNGAVAPQQAPAAVANPVPLNGAVAPQQAPAAVAAPGSVAPAAPVNPNAPARVAPAASAKVPAMPKFKEPGFENESPADFEARRTSAAAANKPIIEAEANKQYAAQNVYPIVKDINAALKTATGSGIGAKVDDIAAFFGHSTDGAKAIAQLEVLGDTLLKAVPRFSGPQSDKDVASYMAAAGKLADAKTPVATRAAAFKTIVDLNKKYAPDLDWSFKEDKDTSLFKSADEIIARGKKK